MGRQNKKRPDKDDSFPDEEVDSRDFANLARAVAMALKGKENSSVECDFCGKAGHLGTACFLNPSNPNNRLPDKLREKLWYLVVTRRNGNQRSLTRGVLTLLRWLVQRYPQLNRQQ
jgi:hypothetical protein